MIPLAQARITTLLTVFVGVFLAVGINFAYTRHVDSESDRDGRENDRTWCQLLALLDSQPNTGPSTAPPTTERGRQIAAAVHDIRVRLGCEIG